MRKVLKKVIFRFIKPLIFRYLSKPRYYGYKGLKIKVLPGVFYPAWIISTKILLEYIERLPLKNKSFLELGAGSGVVGFYAEKKGALVTLTDINSTAIEGLMYNAKVLQSNAQVIESDLFDQIEGPFDYIFINPPYYPKNPTNAEEKAWYCGEDFQYFKKLFAQLPFFIQNETHVIMILSEDCALEHIKYLAQKEGLRFVLIEKSRKWYEWNYLYSVQKISKSA